MEGMTATTSSSLQNVIQGFTSATTDRHAHMSMQDRIMLYAQKSPQEISNRIQELEQEWDVDRCLESQAACVAFTGMVLSWVGGKKWLLLPMVALPMLFYHAVNGTCPADSLLRRFGIRSRREIDAEIYALRMLRGDFDAGENSDKAMRAIEPELRPVE